MSQFGKHAVDRTVEATVLYKAGTSRHQAKIFQMVKPEDFYYDDIRKTYERIKTAWSKGRKIKGDPTVLNAVLEVIGDVDCINIRTQAACEAVVLMAKRRSVLSICQSVMEDTLDFSVTAEQLTKKVSDMHDVMRDERTSGNGEIKMSDAMDSYTAAINQASVNGGSGMTTGIPALDKFQLFKRGELIILAARPSVGKTAMALSMAMGMIQSGLRVGFICTEMTDEEIMARIYSQFGAYSQLATHGPRDNGDLADLAHAHEAVSRLFNNDNWKMSLGADEMTAIDCTDMIKRWVDENDIDVVFVDYIQRLDPIDKRDDEVRVIKRSTQALKNCAKNLDIAIVGLAQLNRNTDGNYRPFLRHLKGSSALEQEANSVWLLSRPERECMNPDGSMREFPSLADSGSDRKKLIGKDMGMVFVDKNRSGPCWQASLNYDPEHMRFFKEDFKDTPCNSSGKW